MDEDNQTYTIDDYIADGIDKIYETINNVDIKLDDNFNDLKEEHEYTEKKGVLFCAESMLNETQFYIVIKRNNSIYSTKIYVKNNENEDEIIKIVSNKFDSFLS